MSRYIHSQQATNKAFKNLDFSDVGTIKEIIFQERRYQEKPIFQGLQKLWKAVRCAGIYIECNTYAAGMQQRY